MGLPIYIVIKDDDDGNFNVYEAYASENDAMECIVMVAEDHRQCENTEQGEKRFECIDHLTKFAVCTIREVKA